MPSAEDLGGLRDQRFARAIDREVAPVWHDRFARMAWRHLPELDAGRGDQSRLVLDVHSGPGRTTAELLERLAPDTRIVALEPSPAMRDLARTRVPPNAKKRVYLKAGDFSDIAEMADDTYDLVLCNVVLSEAQDMETALGALVRITKPGGDVIATMPMKGSWAEAEDLFGEVLHDAGLGHTLGRLRRVAGLRPSGDDLAAVAAAVGLPAQNVVVEQERFSLLFNSGREFLLSSLVDFGPLRLWKAIVSDHANPQEVFFRFKASIDSYFAANVFSVTGIAGVLHLRSPGAEAPAPARTYWTSFPVLDAVFSATERPVAAAATSARPETPSPPRPPSPPQPQPAVPAPDPGVPVVLEDDEDTAPRRVSPPELNPAALAAEDEAIFALLDQSSHRSEPDADLDALLDQVLEFAGGDEISGENVALSVDDLVELGGFDSTPDVKTPGETLKRIKALLPPAPPSSSSRSRPPPPPPSSPKRRKR